jgi:DNA-binding transcriptional ArsR family regulator
MSFKELVIADQRLVILRSLEEMPGYEANESILDSCLDQYGHKVSRDAVRTHISWLAEQGLVSVRELGNTMIAKLTSRGIDVANGSATVPGVKKPRPE